MFKSKKSQFQFGYVSEIDQFLQELEQIPAIKSDSRLDEELKYKKIAQKRDNVQDEEGDLLIWKEF